MCVRGGQSQGGVTFSRAEATGNYQLPNVSAGNQSEVLCKNGMCS